VNVATRARGLAQPLYIILALGVILRALYLPSEGFRGDVSSFESWALTLRDHPIWEFYSQSHWSDYPPGYFLILWVIGHIEALCEALRITPFVDGSFFGLRIFVKLPAVVMDLVDAGVIFALVRRFATPRMALIAAAAFTLNPATIYESAFWGQIESVSWGFVLLALWCAVRSSDDRGKTVPRLTWAWLALAFSILIKPQATVVALALFAFAFTASDPEVRRLRARGTAFGLGAALVFAYAVSAFFTLQLNPIANLSWLYARYAYGSGVYAYNTVNAFNLYAIKQAFWQSDLVPVVVFGKDLGPMVAWGIGLVLVASVLLVGRYLQTRSDRAFLEVACLLAFGFFLLATRMHERYIYGAFLLIFPLFGFARRYCWSALILSFTMLSNLVYSYIYVDAVTGKLPGVDATHMWGSASNLLSLLNVATFFVLGFQFLGGEIRALDRIDDELRLLGARARGWFDPREGIVPITRIDWLLALCFTLASFAVCIAWITSPADKVFDEIYYARAGAEYLAGKDIYEFTHPPLTKLIIAFSMLLFGGLSPLGDSALGWRFLNVVIGALSVGLLYLFAKRLTRSTWFAGAAAVMLLCDGFHFVQSRIATPEITVAFFSLLVLYAFYELWTVSGARRVAQTLWSGRTTRTYLTLLGVGSIVAVIVAKLAVTLGPRTKGDELIGVAGVIVFLYVELGFYLVARWATSSGRAYLDALFGRVDDRTGSLGDPFVVSYADGSRYAYAADGAGTLMLSDGTVIAVAGRDEALIVAQDADLTRRYRLDGRMEYQTPVASATYEPNGDIVLPDARTRGASAWGWLALLAVASGALAASKWNGLFDFFVVWVCALGVALQRLRARPALFGNPFGLPLDVLAGTMLVVAGAIYTLSYVPFFLLGHNFVDMVTLQREMYHYHATLVATHPYASVWWQWPILERPISYFYSDFAPYHTTHVATDCCVAEILALPNPFVWWLGLVSVPLVGILAWRERNRGYALLVIAYFFQWLPWIGSPRIAFEYHFYPNLAIIVLSNAILLQRLWTMGKTAQAPQRLAVFGYLAVVVWGFIFFYPVLAGVHIPWDQWHARMWIDRWII
jgi:dolichyl-phosphate-mannose--protein O-mannosyl transferase